MAEKRPDGFSNLNIAIVSLVALVAIVGTVAIVVNSSPLQSSTASENLGGEARLGVAARSTPGRLNPGPEPNTQYCEQCKLECGNPGPGRPSPFCLECLPSCSPPQTNPPATVSERVTCSFQDANGKLLHTCRASNGQSCSGIDECSVTVSGTNGQRLTWSIFSKGPSCTPTMTTTTLDGTAETVGFNCDVEPDPACVYRNADGKRRGAASNTYLTFSSGQTMRCDGTTWVATDRCAVTGLKKVGEQIIRHQTINSLFTPVIERFTFSGSSEVWSDNWQTYACTKAIWQPVTSHCWYGYTAPDGTYVESRYTSDQRVLNGLFTLICENGRMRIDTENCVRNDGKTPDPTPNGDRDNPLIVRINGNDYVTYCVAGYWTPDGGWV